MSSPEISLIAIFESREDCENVYKGLELASQNNLTAANKLFMEKLDDEFFTIEDGLEWRFTCSCDLEKNKLTINTIDIDFFEIEDFFESISNLGASKIVAEVYDGYEETKKYGFLNGKKKSAKNVLKSIAEDDVDTALEIAIEAGKKNEAIKLLEQGANPNILVHPHTHIASFKWPAIIHCLSFEFNKLSLKLIESGADINIHDPSEIIDNTPLHIAVNCSNYKLVNSLIKAGADVNGVNMDGETPIHNSPPLKILNLLLDNGADINNRDHRGRLAAFNIDYDSGINVLKKHIDYGLDLNACDNDGGNILWHLSHNQKLVNYLQKLGVKKTRPINAFSSIYYDDNDEKRAGIKYDLSNKILISINGLCEANIKTDDELKESQIEHIKNIIDVSVYHNELSVFSDLISRYDNILSKKDIEELIYSEIWDKRLCFIQAINEAKLINPSEYGSYIRESSTEEAYEIKDYFENHLK